MAISSRLLEMLKVRKRQVARSHLLESSKQPTWGYVERIEIILNVHGPVGPRSDPCTLPRLQ